MDLFVFEQEPYSNPSLGYYNEVHLINGRIINNLDSVMWIERYLKHGEFTLKGKVSEGYQELLPIGSLISHLNTSELMIVENHEIEDKGTENSIITITGRSFETFLENRVVSSYGYALAFPIPPNQALPSYTIDTPGTTWDHANLIIENHVYNPFSFTASDSITNVRSVSTVTGLPIVNVTREIKVGDVYSAVIELLAQDNLGIRSIRPGPWTAAYAKPGPSGAFFRSVDFGFEIHNGVDRRREVSFSWSDGDIKSGQYLWTNKNKKTSVLVQGKWYRARISDANVGISRRVGYVDAGDIDQQFGGPPGGADYDRVSDALVARGELYLAAQKDITISRIELVENSSRFDYRIDYNVGDIVAVNGNYDTKTVMRVAEFVEIQDDKGYVGYPTLEALPEE